MTPFVKAINENKMKILTLMGVLLLREALCEDESEISLPAERPIAEGAFLGKERQLQPEVVLQLKYDRGELNRIYLAQFRKNSERWVPSVPARDDLCSDLCHAGLGGTPCGTTCAELIPVGLQAALQEANTTGAEYGQPRVSVCPTLCANNLGQPLCSCVTTEDEDKSVEWSEVCAAFCVADHYVLGGCPPCKEIQATNAVTLSRALTTVEGWSMWCNAQCRQGQGGAACNCDRSPY